MCTLNGTVPSCAHCMSGAEWCTRSNEWRNSALEREGAVYTLYTMMDGAVLCTYNTVQCTERCRVHAVWRVVCSCTPHNERRFLVVCRRGKVVPTLFILHSFHCMYTMYAKLYIRIQAKLYRHEIQTDWCFLALRVILGPRRRFTERYCGENGSTTLKKHNKLLHQKQNAVSEFGRCDPDDPQRSRFPSVATEVVKTMAFTWNCSAQLELPSSWSH